MYVLIVRHSDDGFIIRNINVAKHGCQCQI
jgi:hypothetical protein